IVLSWRRTRDVPVEEADQPVAVHDRVVRRRVLVTNDPPGLHRATGEPPLVRGRHEDCRRVMDASYPFPNLYQSRVLIDPSRPGIPVADHLAGEIREHLTPLLIKAERPGNALDVGMLEVPQQGVYGRRPRCGPLVDDVTDPDGAVGVAAG